VDLVTVAQAFHWFKQDAFFSEARRVLRPGGVLAFWCYSLCSITPEVDSTILRFYNGELGPYWEKERLLVDDLYRNVQVPFEEIQSPRFEITATWSLEQLVGYLGTWSALQTYIKKNGSNPLKALYPELKSAWGSQVTRTVRWPIGLRVARCS
jgi:ubiquinone/menaquinone biosynthesis C-methylase UbiE